jgi:hypothetical protein
MQYVAFWRAREPGSHAEGETCGCMRGKKGRDAAVLFLDELKPGAIWFQDGSRDVMIETDRWTEKWRTD